MFEIGKKYWFTEKGTTKDKFITKGKVIEETQFVVKVERDDGIQRFIVMNNLLSVNEAKD